MKFINQDIRMTPLSELSEHPENPRKGDMDSLKESIDVNGFYGVIVAQLSTGRVLVGNHRYRSVKAEGGNQIPVAWVDVDDEHALRILLADNRTSDLAEYDEEVLFDLLSELAETDLSFAGTGYDESFLESLAEDEGEEDEQKYTLKVESPVYEPKGDKPPVDALYNNETTQALQENIHKAELPDNVKDFLLAASYRHTVFDYSQIAEFYAHADPQLQGLMEESALVIIDFKQAIEKGFVKVTEEVKEQYLRDFPEEGA